MTEGHSLPELPYRPWPRLMIGYLHGDRSIGAGLTSEAAALSRAASVQVKWAAVPPYSRWQQLLLCIIQLAFW
jgi:hypothetical protein